MTFCQEKYNQLVKQSSLSSAQSRCTYWAVSGSEVVLNGDVVGECCRQVPCFKEGMMKWQQLLLFGRGRVKTFKSLCHVENSLIQQLCISSTILVLVAPWQCQHQIRIDRFTVQMDCIRVKVTNADAECMLKPTWTCWQIEDFQNYVWQSIHISLHTDSNYSCTCEQIFMPMIVLKCNNKQ